MTIAELKQAIMKDSLSTLYGSKLIFIGEESYLQNVYINQLAKKTKAKVTYADDYLSIKRRLTTNTMLDNSGIFVIRNNNQILKDEELFDKIIPAKNKYLILIYDKMDKRKPLYKNNGDIICEFEKMGVATLTKIIHKTLPNLSEDNCKYLCELVGNDYGRLMLEIDKLNLMQYDSEANGYYTTNDETFGWALKEGVIYQELTDTSFQLLDSILIRDIPNVFNCLQIYEQSGEDAFKMLGLLYSNYKNMLLLRCNPNINLSAFVKRKLGQISSKYSPIQLINKLKIIQSTEQGIKSGLVESDIALTYTIIKLLWE